MAASTTCPKPDSVSLPQRRDDAEGQEECTAAEVADQIERGDRRTILQTDSGERTGQCDVVDVVPRHLGEGTLLTPSGHSTIDQPWIALEKNRRTQSEPFHYPGAKSLDDYVSLVRSVQAEAPALLGSNVALQYGTTTVEDRIRPAIATGSIDPNHLRTEIGKQHRAVGARPNAS